MEKDARPAAVDMALDDVIRTSRTPRPPPRSLAPRRMHTHSNGARRADAHERWTHDLYGSVDGDADRRVGRRGSDLYVTVTNDAPRSNGSARGSYADAGRILVSNLHHEVTRDDLVELFGRVATVCDVKMHYDRAGRSNGSANVSFARRRDALVAADRFHHVPLDGYPMQIEVVSVPPRSPSGYAAERVRSPRESPRPYARAYPPRPAPRTSFADRRREQSPRRPPAEAHALDAELESYMMRQ